MKRQAFITWTVIVLAGIGLLSDVIFYDFILLKNLLIPVIVFAVIFLLFRFYQPSRSKKHPKVKPSRKTMEKAPGIRKSTTNSSSKKKKSYPFQVIEGQKGKNDDNTPKYH
ncbi:hypothetical protein D3C76_1006880 [compost metagenome]